MRSTKCKMPLLALLIAVVISAIGCSKSKDGIANKPHKLVFKAEASAGSSLHMAVYGYDASLTTVSALGGTTWTSPELTAPANASLASIVVNAMGVNTSSQLKVQVFVDGVLKKEGNSSGTALSATAQFNLR